MAGARSYPGHGGSLRALTAAVTVLALGATLTACFDSQPVTAPSGIKVPPVSTVTVTSTASTTTAPRPSSPPPSTTTSARSTSRSSASSAPSGSMLSDVRLGRREGADRLVLQFTGAAPSYSVARGSGPILECGSGAVVGSTGEYLLITVEPITLHDERGNSPYAGERAVAGPGRAISEAIIFCSFEGRLQVAVKLAGSGQGYTDSTLSGPGRIVVDVRDG